MLTKRQYSKPAGVFNPIDGLAQRTTDYEVRRLRPQSGLSYENPDGATGVDSIYGFDNPVPLPDGLAVFHSDGSLESAGVFRFTDGRANYLEIRIAPPATGKVQLRKYNEDLAPNWDGSHWYAAAEMERSWAWN